MALYRGPLFGDQHRGYKIYGFEREDADIIFIIDTQIVTEGAKIFSLITSGTCSYIVYWGDGTSETVNASGTFTKTRTYDTAGIYNVNIKIISGVFVPYYNNNPANDLILTIRGKYNTVLSDSFQNAFYGALNLKEFTVDLTGVTSLNNSFNSCPALVDFNNNPASIAMKKSLFNFRDLSNVTDIRGAFIATGSISFNGFNLSSLSGSQSAGTNAGVFGRNFAPSQVVSIGTATDPIVFGTTGGNTFSLQYFALGCSSLTQAYFDSGVKITSLYQAFSKCSSLDFFDVLDKDLSNVTDIRGAFIGTGSLELKGLRFEGLSGSQQFGTNEGVFGSNLFPSKVTSIGTALEPILLGTTGGNTIILGNFAYLCSFLTQAYFDSGFKITSLSQAFYRCSSLDFFDVIDKDLSNVTDIRGAFIGTRSISFDGFNLSSLTSTTLSSSEGVFGSNLFPSKVTSIGTALEPIVFGNTGGNTFSIRLFAYGCSFLTQVHFDSSVKITDWYRAFYNCSSLTTFRNLDVATGFTNVTTMQDAFFGCALDAASIENILVSCDNGGKTGISLSLSGGTNAIYSTWTAAAQTALSNLQTKSWTITYRT